MSRLTTTFARLKTQQKSAFIPFITAGDGGLDTTLSLMNILVTQGADIIELGVPFSDPMADGKVIEQSHGRALANGVNLTAIFNLVSRFRKKNSTTPLVLMGYANPIELFGYQAFAKVASESGVDGVLIVDMPPEESNRFKQQLDYYHIDLIFLVSPTTSKTRLKLLAKQVSGFVYFVALKGVTGAKNFHFNDVKTQLDIIRRYIDLPIGVGFGIQDEKIAKAVADVADAVIIGSRLVAIIAQYQNNEAVMFDKVKKFTYNINQALIS